MRHQVFFKAFLLIFSLGIRTIYSSVQVFPMKVLLKQGTRTAQLSVRHRGEFKTTYKIHPVFYKQSSNGAMTLVKKAEKIERSLVDHIRFSPKRVTLKPGEEQIVRVMLRNLSKLTEGDYRAHLRFVPVEKENHATVPQEGIPFAFNIDARIAVAIPVLYRHGRPKGNVKIDKFSFKKQKNEKYALDVTLSKDSEIFPMGSLKVFQKNKQVVEVRGIQLYVNKRNLKFNVKPEQLDLSDKNFVLKYVSEKALGGEILAQASLKSK